MAGSLNHMVKPDGTFTMSLLDGHGDCEEALEECHQIIAALLEEQAVGAAEKLNLLTIICNGLSYPVPKAAPVLQPNSWGAEARGAYERDHPNG